jgi:hypothetical protein
MKNTAILLEHAQLSGKDFATISFLGLARKEGLNPGQDFALDAGKKLPAGCEDRLDRHRHPEAAWPSQQVG